MTFALEKLLVLQRSVELADDVCTATEQFQLGFGFLVDELSRGALSISPSIAECSVALQKPTANPSSVSKPSFSFPVFGYGSQPYPTPYPNRLR